MHTPIVSAVRRRALLAQSYRHLCAADRTVVARIHRFEPRFDRAVQAANVLRVSVADLVAGWTGWEQELPPPTSDQLVDPDRALAILRRELRRARLRAKVAQTTAATAIGRHQSVLARLETGDRARSAVPSLHAISTLATLYGVDLHELMVRCSRPNPRSHDVREKAAREDVSPRGPRRAAAR